MARYSIGQCQVKSMYDNGLGLYWFKYTWDNLPGMSLELKNLPACCGMQVLHKFSYGGFLNPKTKRWKNITQDIANQMLQGVNKAMNLRSTGCVGAITNPRQAAIWDKVLEKNGFKELLQFKNKGSGNDLTLFVKYNEREGIAANGH